MITGLEFQAPSPPPTRERVEIEFSHQWPEVQSVMPMEWHLHKSPEVWSLESNLAGGHTHSAAKRVEEGGLRLFPGTTPRALSQLAGPEPYFS